MRQLFVTLFVGVVLTTPGILRAQSATDYPSRPIKLVVGFAPGGATDTLARLLTGVLGQELGQTVYVENIAGASGYIAWRNVAASTPDGYTLLLAENAVAIRPGFKDMTPTFDPVTELDAVASVAHSPLALCVADAVPVNSVKDLIAYSHSSGKTLNYASAGRGRSPNSSGKSSRTVPRSTHSAFPTGAADRRWPPSLRDRSTSSWPPARWRSL
jgi:Uncharacterized protein conserved in bacteria